jgi:pyruvate/2-oxoglutarate dehydrogenase complex dihydrolipoamide acyltransferase (E2) component
MSESEYDILQIPRSRMPTIDGGKLANQKYHMMGLLEIDITNLRKNLKAVLVNGRRISFIAYTIKTIGDCIAENTAMHALLHKNKKTIEFHDVDISLPIERHFNGNYFPFPLIIRATNLKKAIDIDTEINEAVTAKYESEDDLIPFQNKKIGKIIMALFYSMPQKLRLFIMKTAIKNPFRSKQIMGTVGITTVNMAGRLSGWVFPLKNPYNLYFALGSINKKPKVVGDQIAIRDILNLSVIFNHDTIDGAMAKRFINELVRKIEDGKIEI